MLEPGTARFERRERSGRADGAGTEFLETELLESAEVMVRGYPAVCRLATEALG
jgi:hypothetical protein